MRNLVRVAPTTLFSTMASKAAEQLLAGTGWLPALLRTPPSDLERKVAGGDQGSDVYPQAAE